MSLKTIKDFFTGKVLDDAIASLEADRQEYINSLDERQQALYAKLCEEDPPLHRYILRLEKRVHDLEQKSLK